MIPNVFLEKEIDFFDTGDAVLVRLNGLVPRYTEMFQTLIAENNINQTYYGPDLAPDFVYERLIREFQKEYDITDCNLLRREERRVEVGMSRNGENFSDERVPPKYLNFRVRFRFKKPSELKGRGVAREYFHQLGADGDESWIEEFESRPDGPLEGSPECPVDNCMERYAEIGDMQEHCLEEHGFWDDSYSGVLAE